MSSPSETVYNGFDFEPFIDWFNALTDNQKIYTLNANKFTSLDIIEKIPERLYQGYKKVYFGMMSTGNHGSRRNLKNSIDNSKRENPKAIHEGEEQENYFLFAFKNAGDIDFIFQDAGRGVKTLHIKNYFDKYINEYLTQQNKLKDFKLVEGAVISTPEVMIDRLERVTKTKIYIDKSILDEDNLALTDRTLSVRENLVIDVRAQRGKDIKEFLQDIRQKIVYNTKIDKLWIEGKDHHGNISSFYLNQIQKSAYITIDIDPGTSALIKDDMQRELLNLL